MSGRTTRSAARLTAACAVLVLAGVSAATAARPGNSLRKQLQTLHVRSHDALLDLYALDSRLQAVQSRLTSLQAQADDLRRQRQLLTQQVAATRHTLRVSLRELGRNLRMLYKQGDVSTLAVVLGAQNLDEAVTKLDALTNVADESRQVVHASVTAELRLVQLRRTLVARGARLTAALRDAQQSRRALVSAQSQRRSFLDRLRAGERLKTAQIAALQRAAARVQRKSNEIQASAAAAAEATAAPIPAAPIAPAASPTTSTRTITVSSTGYSLSGRTSTGIPVGWGVVAVDPSVIPLGTRVTVPGYGAGVAADVGSSVRGADIDLWFPTLAQARAWGRRTVTITLH